MLIDRIGTFKATVVDHGVSITTNGYPQFVAKFSATEIWDEEESKWVDWSDYDQQITGYLVLFGAKGETLNCQSLKKVLNWDGNSFKTLAEGDYSSTVVQIRVAEHTYKDKTSLQVDWIDAQDAVPGASVKKLDTSELAALDAEYSKLLKAGGKKAAPATASKPSKPKPPAKTTAVQDEMDKLLDKPVEEDSHPVVSGPPEEDMGTESPEIKPMTKSECWNEILSTVPGSDDDPKVVADISAAWTEAVKTVGKGKKTSAFTKPEFGEVYEIVVHKLVKF